jgi:ribosomal protein S18 acetylase RimI-like enzyme
LGDAGPIAELFLQAVAAAMPYLPAIHTDDQVRAWIRDVVLPNTEVWVAVEGPAPIGFISIVGTALHHLYVAPCDQGRGVGSRLLTHAKERSPGRLGLYVFQRNAAARAFYRAHGFVEVAFGDGTGNEEREPDVRSEWVRESLPENGGR